MYRFAYAMNLPLPLMPKNLHQYPLEFIAKELENHPSYRMTGFGSHSQDLPLNPTQETIDKFGGGAGRIYDLDPENPNPNRPNISIQFPRQHAAIKQPWNHDDFEEEQQEEEEYDEEEQHHEEEDNDESARKHDKSARERKEKKEKLEAFKKQIAAARERVEEQARLDPDAFKLTKKNSTAP
jgi:hypothetical protein